LAPDDSVEFVTWFWSDAVGEGVAS